MSWARINFERKQVNKVLTRCKNSKHESHKKRVKDRDQKRLQES